LRIDIKRREVLTATVGSPLVGLVDPDTPATLRAVNDMPTALDLPDIPIPGTKPAQGDTPPPRKPASTPVTSPAPVAVGISDEDVSDWI
jgi:hypothetical protein